MRSPLVVAPALAAVAAMGCFVDEGSSSGVIDPTEASSTGVGPTTGGEETSGKSTSATGTTSTTNTSAMTATTATTTSSSSTATTSTTSPTDGSDSLTDDPPSVCGDGILGGLEQCDDGDQNGLGGPCTAECKITVCGDGYRGGDEECDDGNAESGDTCSAMCDRVALRVFLSSATYTGNLGGLAGADAKCQGLAEAAGLPGTFRAWLADDIDAPSTRFTHGLPYLRVDNMSIANSYDAMTTSFSLLTAISIDEYGLGNMGIGGCDGTADKVWTNVQPDGTRYGDAHCNGWSAAGSDVFPAPGESDQASGQWTTGTCTVSCGSQLHLYCFEQL